jgi:hypothetical protein
MKRDPKELHRSARQVALGSIILTLLIFPGMFLSQLPPTKAEIIITGIFIAGLILGMKWPLIGGLMCIILPVSFLFAVAIDLINKPAPIGATLLSISFALFISFFLSLPGILYLEAWYAGFKKQKNNS